ncbi:hypothetical protein HOY80DRAFT_291267 [Tuber brumale]|nr:hypothetical protein HOY80DRAFT_291267 [Tuber brumale]
MSKNLPQRSLPLSPLRPPPVRRASAVSMTNSFRSDFQLQEASSCSFAPMARGAITLINLPPSLPPKDETPQFSPGVSGHAFFLDGKFKPLPSPLETDTDVYVVEPVGAVGGRTLYKITGDKDEVSDLVYLYDPVLDEFFLTTKPRRFPTTLSKRAQCGGRVGRSFSVPFGKGPNTQRKCAGLDKRGEGSSGSWLHIDVHKPIPIVEKGLHSAITSRFTEEPLPPSRPASRGPAKAGSSASPT